MDAMISGDSELKQSDDIVEPDAPTDAEPVERTDEANGGKVESGWDDFPHTLQSLKNHDSLAWLAFVKRQNIIAENLILGRFSRGSNKVTAEDAQDMAAKLYDKLWNNIGEFRTFEAVGAWFVKALNNDALDLISKKKAAKHGAGKVDSLDAGKGNEPTDKFTRAKEYTNEYHKLHDKNFDWEIIRQRDPADQAMLDVVRRRLDLCRQQLKPKEQQFIDCEQRQLTHKETAVECGCTTKEVGSKLNRIHKKLAKLLKELELKEDM